MLEEKNYRAGKVLSYVIKTAWQVRPTIYLVYFVKLVAACIGKLQVVLLPKFLVDELTLLRNSAEPMEHIQMVVIYAGVIVISHLSANVLENLVQWRKEPMKEWMDSYLEELLAEHTMSMDYEHTEDPAALEQVAKAKDGISWYSGGILGILDKFYTIVKNVIILLGVIFVILLKCPMLLPVQLAALALISFFNAKINKNEIEQYAKLSKTNRMFGYILYSLADFSYGKDIRLYDSADMMKEKGNAYIRTSIGNWKTMAKFRERNSWCMDGVNTIRDGISYFYIGYLAIKNVLTLGDFTMCVSAASNLYQSLYQMVSGVQEVIKKCNYMADFLKFLDYPAAMPKGSKEPKEGEHVIEFCHVSFKYPRSEKYVLRDINLTIRSGEHLSIVGLNGAGKTTFVKLLCRLYDVTEGEIKIDGINIKEYSDEAYRRLFSVVFQDFKLFAFSLSENILLGENTEDASRLEEVLKLAGLYEDAMKLPKGVDTMIYKSFDEDGVELSGGQKQKTAIARALYRNAPIVILDEPTAALDPVAEYEIYRRFDELVGGKTAIYISHRLSSCKFCDRIAVFADDTIKEYGTHDALVGLENGIYAEMFAAQAQYYVENASEAAVA